MAETSQSPPSELSDDDMAALGGLDRGEAELTDSDTFGR